MRNERWLNVLSRSRLRVQRGAQPRLAGARDRGSEAAAAPPRRERSSHAANQKLVAILAPVLG